MACCHDSACSSNASAKALDNPYWRRALWIALVINGAFFMTEIVAGAAAGSSSLQADALDFFGAAGNYAISLGVAGMALTWRARAALVKGGTLILFALWVLASTAWAAIHGTLPRAEVMGVVGIAALIANGSVAPMLYQFLTGKANIRSVCNRKPRRAARGYGRVRHWHRLARCDRRRDHGWIGPMGRLANYPPGTRRASLKSAVPISVAKARCVSGVAPAMALLTGRAKLD